MLKSKYLHLLVLLPLNINHLGSTREKVVKTNIEEDRNLGTASIKNLGMKLFSGINRDINGILLFVSKKLG